MSEQKQEPVQKFRVRVWFGSHTIADHIAEAEQAERYAAAMDRRFPGLRITNDPLPVEPVEPRPLPAEQLWGLVPN